MPLPCFRLPILCYEPCRPLLKWGWVVFLCMFGMATADAQPTQMERVYRALGSGDCKGALEILEGMPRPSQQDAEFWVAKTQALQCVGRHEEAYREIKRAWRVTRDSNGNTWFWKGELEIMLGKNNRAHQTFSAGVEQFPGHPALWKALGTMEEGAGNAPEAERCFRRYYELKPDQGFILRNLAYAQIAQQKNTDALTTLTIAESQLPKENWPLMMAGDVYFSMGQYNEASRKYTAITESDPGNVEAWIAKGEAAYRIPVPQAAEECFERALALADTLPRAWMGRAKLRISYRQFDLAVGDLEKALQLDPQQPEACLLLGRCHFELQQFEQSLAAFDRGISHNAKDADAWLYRGDVLARLQRMDEALKSWQKAEKLGSGKATGRIGFYTQGE